MRVQVQSSNGGSSRTIGYLTEQPLFGAVMIPSVPVSLLFGCRSVAGRASCMRALRRSEESADAFDDLEPEFSD